MAERHQKHTKLERPNKGTFGRSEWAIIGAPCGEIKKLSTKIIQQLSEEYKIAYVDADHQGASVAKEEKTPLDYGASLVYTDKIEFHQFNHREQPEKFRLYPEFNEQDIILINGNHFTGQHQIVIIDSRKEVSLSKKLDRLTNVQMILLTDEETPVYDFLTKHLRGIAVPIFPLDATEMIAGLIKQKIHLDTPPVYGLVLAGGKSTRMGEDKGMINYHGKPQREYAADLLAPYCEKVFISCREEQLPFIETAYGLLPDTFLGLGPYGGILSAFQKHPNAAWMVVACDLPLLDGDVLDTLSGKRNPAKIATCFKSAHNEFPEPLITIWEPKSYPILLSFLSQGYSCPRKVLINTDALVLPTPEGDKLRNVNTPEEREEI